MTELYSLHRLTIDDAGQQLFAALATAIPGLSRHQARQAVSAGLVTVRGARVLEPKSPLPAKARVECDLRHGIKKPFLAKVHAEIAPAEKPFTILHEDSSLVIVDKAAGVLSAPSERGEHGHVPELLRRAWRKRGRDVRFIGVVHRLDKDTSGCLCFALTREAQRLIAAQFAAHSASRVYRCLVQGGPRKDQDTLAGRITHGMYGRRVLLRDAPDGARARDDDSSVEDDDEDDGDDRQDDGFDDEDFDDHDDGDAGEDRGPRAGGGRGRGDAGKPGKEAVTSFKVMKRWPRAADLEVSLETGRTHQIRVSLAAIGCPVLGDRVYGFRGADRTLAPGQTPLPRPPRLMLHAQRLALDHPMGGERLVVDAPLPREFTEYASRLK